MDDLEHLLNGAGLGHLTKESNKADDLGDMLSGAGLGHLVRKRWIQNATKHMKEGAFTKQALRHGETPKEYAKEVLAHPKNVTERTRKRAQFVKNVLGRHFGEE